MKQKTKEHKKRILYPWIKRKQGKAYKTMLALIAEQNNFIELKEQKIKKNKFFKDVFNKTEFYFPEMYKSVSKFYSLKGRDINKKEYEILCLARLQMMIRYIKNKNEIIKLKEHPDYTKKLKSSIKLCKKLLKNKITYDQYIKGKKNDNPI